MPNKQLKRAHSNRSSQDLYYGVANQRSDRHLNKAQNPVQQSVNTSGDLSLIQQSLAKNFSQHFQNAVNQVANQQSQNFMQHDNMSQDGSIHHPSNIMHVNQSNATNNTMIGLLMRQSNDSCVHVSDSIHGNPNQMSQLSQNNHTTHMTNPMMLKSLDNVNESYANLNPCLESQSSNNYLQTHSGHPGNYYNQANAVNQSHNHLALTSVNSGGGMGLPPTAPL